MPRDIEPLLVGRIELQRIFYFLDRYINNLFKLFNDSELRDDVTKEEEEELRVEVIKILTDPRFQNVRGYIRPDRLKRHRKFLTRASLFRTDIKRHLNARKR